MARKIESDHIFKWITFITLGIGIIVVVFLIMRNSDSNQNAQPTISSSNEPLPTPSTTNQYINTNAYPVYVPAGDSLSQGYFSSTQEKSFPYVLAEKLKMLNPESASSITSTGVYGGKLEEGLKKESISAIVAAKPDIITFEYGTNDAGDNPAPTPIDTFEMLINDWVTQVTTHGKPLIVFVTTWNQGPRGDAYDEAIIKTAQKYGYPYVNVKDLYMNESNKGPANQDTWRGKTDTFHPNDAGHEAIADAIFRAIKSYKSP